MTVGGGNSGASDDGSSEQTGWSRRRKIMTLVVPAVAVIVAAGVTPVVTDLVSDDSPSASESTSITTDDGTVITINGGTPTIITNTYVNIELKAFDSTVLRPLADCPYKESEPGITFVQALLRPADRGQCFDQVLEEPVAAGDRVTMMILYRNRLDVDQRSVVGANLSDYVRYVEGSTTVYNADNPNGVKLDSDNVATGGIQIGTYAPGTNAIVTFDLDVDQNKAFSKCGDYGLTQVGVVQPKDSNIVYNTTKMAVNIPC